jgi:nucleoid-associated protein YgaU
VRAPGSDARSSSAGDYVIQDGDTLSEIARRQMGSALLWTEIYKENEDVLKDPANIPAGQKIRIPAGNKQHEAVVPPRPARNTQETATSQEPAGSYVVKDGDTLTRIARKHYGQESMYLEILRANSHQIENPAGIYPGMVLRLP